VRAESAVVLFVVVLAVSSVSFAVPVGSSSAVETRGIEQDRPRGALDSDGVASGSVAVPSPDESAPLAGFDQVHEAGITGADVRVGVVGSAFATDRGHLGDAVVDRRRFAPQGPGLIADSSHDTAVAEVVSRTAPDADIYLASIGRGGGPQEYADAVAWLRARDVDVIVDAGSYFPKSADDRERLNAVAAAATENGTAFVTSAGNYADRHWTGQGSEGWIDFGNDTRYNTLGDGEVSGPVSLRLYWSGTDRYDLYLYRAVDGEDQLVAKSATNETGDGRHSEAIDATLPSGRYYVAVRGDAGANGTVELFSSSNDLAISSEDGGIVAPATAEGVVAVGAVDSVTGDPRPYSSMGPALDISAPDGTATTAAGEFYGSSAAAPLVAGTLTLMLAENESLTPTEAQRVLREAAIRVDGRLYLDTASAVRAVAPASSVEPRRPLWIQGGTNETRD
jgi:hypothetical protein